MIKIKDNVDLKELGFEEYEAICYKNCLAIDKETRQIFVVRISSAEHLLFDLIQAGLVEKVEE